MTAPHDHGCNGLVPSLRLGSSRCLTAVSLSLSLACGLDSSGVAAGSSSEGGTSGSASATDSSTVSATAERLTQVSPVDVNLAPTVQGTAQARVRLTTFDGVLIDGELIPSDGKIWLKLVARGQTPEQDPAALDINNHVSDWAFALSPSDVETVAPPLSTLIPGSE